MEFGHNTKLLSGCLKSYEDEYKHFKKRAQ
jgi:hypothetical protein